MVVNHLVNCTQFCVRSTNCAITISNCIGVNGDSGIWSILNWSVVHPIASGVYEVGASMSVEYTELVLTVELHSMSFWHHLELPSRHTWNEFLCLLGITFWQALPGITFWQALPSITFWQALPGITLILITPGHFSTDQTGLEIPFYARWALLFDWPKKEGNTPSFYVRLCLALPGFCLALIQAIRLITW